MRHRILADPMIALGFAVKNSDNMKYEAGVHSWFWFYKKNPRITSVCWWQEERVYFHIQNFGGRSKSSDFREYYRLESRTLRTGKHLERKALSQDLLSFYVVRSNQLQGQTVLSLGTQGEINSSWKISNLSQMMEGFICWISYQMPSSSFN